MPSLVRCFRFSYIDGSKNAFGIHSPSTVMAEQGGFLISGLFNGVTEKWGSVKQWFTEALDNITQTISEAWGKVKESTSNIWNGIVSTVKDAVNGVIGVINRMISTVVDGINSLFSLLSFNISIPGIGDIGFDLPQFSAPQIPYLAQGAVIPPNKQFLAVLGDQKHGTNVEASLDTIKQAVAEVLRQQGVTGNNDGDIIIEFRGNLAHLGKVLEPVVTRQQRNRARATGV